jgi:hypothetical protein
MNRILWLRYWLIIVGLLSVISCGGGGGSGGVGSNNPPSSSIGSSQSSSSSSSTTAALPAPQNVSVVAGNASVSLSWTPVSGATAYRVYYASEAKILIQNIASFDDGVRLDNVNSPLSITNLRNDTTWYFVVTAVNGNQESIASMEVSATPSNIDISEQPTAQEVLVLELVNRARANPEAEATRLGIGLNDGITGTPITATPKQPLAHNLLLIKSSRRHSQWMLDADVFSHTGENNSTPHERMVAAGYQFTGSWMSGENIAWSGTTASSINLTTYAASQHDGLFKSPGHRVNILNDNFRELGVGQQQGYFMQDGRNYLSSMLTENFARSGTNYFLTGVVYEDKNSNNFYDVGEGLSGVSITISGKSHPVFATGAYAIPLSNGSYNVTVTGDVLGTAVYHTVQVADQNRKLDVIKMGASVSVSTP